MIEMNEKCALIIDPLVQKSTISESETNEAIT